VVLPISIIHLIDPFEYARTIKPKKGGFYLVLSHHMQIPAAYCRPTAKHTFLPTAHHKASCWAKWFIRKIFVAEAKTPNGKFRLIITKISHSLTSKYCKSLSIYRKPLQKWLLAQKWDQNRKSCYQAGQRCTSKAAVNNRLGKNPVIWQHETAKVSDKFLSAHQAKPLC